MALALCALTALAPSLVAAAVVSGGGRTGLLRLRYDDALEPNDDPSRAAKLVDGVEVDDLVLTPGDVDWFAIDIPAGKALLVEVAPAATDEGGLTIHRPDGVRVASTTSARQATMERVAWWPGPQGGPARVRAWGARPSYALVARLVDPTGRFEPNDAPEGAPEVRAGAPVRGVVANGVDCYRVLVPRGRGLKASLANAADGLTLDWAMGPASTAATSSATKLEAGPVAADRSVVLKVVGSGAYDLELDLEAPPPAATSRRGPLLVRGGRFEPNGPRREQARTIEAGRYPNLVCDGDDWFKVEVPEEGVLSVTLTFSHKQADLDLEVVDARGRSLQASMDADDDEAVAVRASAAGPLFVHVSGGKAPYVMSVDTAPGEPGEPLAPGEYLDLRCSGNDVWAVKLAPSQTLEARVGWAHNDGHLQLELCDRAWNPIQGQVDQSWEPNGRRWLTGSAIARSDGLVLVRVSGAEARYHLKLDVTAPAAALPSGPLQPGTYQNLLCNGEATFQLDVRRGQRTRVDLQFRPGQGDIDLELQDARGNRLASSTTGGSRETLQWVSSADQTITIRAFTYGPSNRFQMTIAQDDTGPGAEQAPGTYLAQTCKGRTTYRVRVPAGRSLSAVISFKHAESDLDLAIVDGQGQRLGASEGTGDLEQVAHTAVADETVTVVVQNQGSGPGTFDLTLTLE